jgi:hypothetical protein
MKVRNPILVQIILLVAILSVRAIGDSSSATQPTGQAAMTGSVDGIVVGIDVDKRTVKVVVWDSGKGDFKQNDAGRYQARTLHWSGDTLIEDQGEKKIAEIQKGDGLSDLKSFSDLTGWKTTIDFEDDNVSKISLVEIFSGESFAGMGGNNGFAFAQQPSGKVSDGRVKELDAGSDSLDPPAQTLPNLAAHPQDEGGGTQVPAPVAASQASSLEDARVRLNLTSDEWSALEPMVSRVIKAKATLADDKSGSQESKTALTAAQNDLRGFLTLQQQAELVQIGLLAPVAASQGSLLEDARVRLNLTSDEWSALEPMVSRVIKAKAALADDKSRSQELKTALTAAQNDLRGFLTPSQQAELVQIGLLE